MRYLTQIFKSKHPIIPGHLRKLEATILLIGDPMPSVIDLWLSTDFRSDSASLRTWPVEK